MKIVSLADFQKTGQIPADATWATVSLGFKGRTGDLVAVTMSYDKTARYGLQTPFSEGTNGLLKGSMWHVDSTHNSLITTGNGGTEDTRAQVTLFYNGGQGKYRLEQRLSPGQQIWLNLAELVRNQIPDSDGKTIPPDVMFGSYELRDLDHHAQGLLYEGKVVVDKTYGHASYGCAHCCGFSSAQVSPLPFSGPPGINNTDTYQAFGVCQSSWEDFDFATNWQSSNTAVATLPSYTLHTVAVGTARGSARNTLAYQQYVGYPCPNEPMVGQQPVQVSYPTITSMDPNPIMVGTSPPDGKLTITGIGFGTSPSVTLPAGVSSSGQASTGTQIILTGVTVAVSAIVGNNNVTVTANGVPSSPATLTIDGPYHMIVQDDRTGPCSGCQTTVRRLVTYQIQNFSGTNAGVLNLGEDISFSSWNCQQSWPGASTNSCATNPATTLSSGIFTDGWTLGSDAFTPAGCGNNVIDHWQWCGHSPAQTLGTLTGYQHTDHISINGVVSPATMTYGTVVPF
jgi:hypothetical protein